MRRTVYLSWASIVPLLVSPAASAEPAVFVPRNDGGDVVLFDAGQGELGGLRNYTASWRKGSDLKPTATPVSKGGQPWIEFAFHGRQGMACSTFCFDKPPAPDVGRQYRGIRLVMHCDRDDYADRSQAILPVRLTNDVKRFDTASATRATLDNRYVWSIDDAHGAPVHLFQWEWANPRPDEEIVQVIAEHDGILDVSLAVFAVSGRALRSDTVADTGHGR